MPTHSLNVPALFSTQVWKAHLCLSQACNQKLVSRATHTRGSSPLYLIPTTECQEHTTAATPTATQGSWPWAPSPDWPCLLPQLRWTRWTGGGGRGSQDHSVLGPVCPSFHFSPWLNWPSPAGDSHICQASCHLLLLVRWLYCLPWSSEGQPAAGESLKLTWLFRFHFLPALLRASIYGRGPTR